VNPFRSIVSGCISVVNWKCAVFSGPSCRFLGLKKPGGSAFKTSVAVAVVACIWIYNAAFNIPMFTWADVHRGWSGGLTCYPVADRAYSLAARIINFYVPLSVTWSSYVGIIYKFRRSMNKVIFLPPAFRYNAICRVRPFVSNLSFEPIDFCMCRPTGHEHNAGIKNQGRGVG